MAETRTPWVRSGPVASLVQPAHGGPEPIDVVPGLVAVLALIVVNGVFVAAEFALVAVDPARLAGRGRSGQLVVGLRQRLSFHLSGAQLGITVTSLLIGFLVEPSVGVLLERYLAVPSVASVPVALAVVTMAQMVVGELVPKNVAIARPESTAILLGPVVHGYGVLFGRLIEALDALALRAVRRLGIEPAEELSGVRSLPELQLLFEASAALGTLGAASSDRLGRAARLEQKSAADALVPRLDVVALLATDSVQDLVDASCATGFSRFPVHRGDLDDVVGVVHVRAAHDVAPEMRGTTTLGELAVEVLVVPETASLARILAPLRRSPMAIVVDEYGGSAGIVTLEDVVEEIVGDIDDEHDPLRPELTAPLRAGEHLVAGTAHADDLLELCGFELPDGNYETIAGFVLDRLGRVPDAAGDVVRHDGWTVEVVDVDRRRISSVRLRSPENPENVDGGAR